MRLHTTAIAIALAASGLFGGSSAQADAVSDFYKGKSVSIVIGFPPGGGYDTNARVLARHLGKYIPGEPQVVAANMPGAGSLVAANNLFNAAPKDGTTIGIFASSVAVDSILGNPQVKFKALDFGWLGSMSQEVAFCGVWQKPGAPQSMAQMMTQEAVFGGGAPSAITFQHPLVVKNVTHAKIRVVKGYRGTRDIYLAMERGEVNGICGLYTSSLHTMSTNDLKSGKLRLVVQMGSKIEKAFGDVPSIFDFAKTDEDRAVLDVHFGQMLLSRPFVVPPGVPAERVEALRKAFKATLADKDFLADAKKAGLDIDYVPPQDIVALLKKYTGLSPAVLKRAKEAAQQ